MTELTGGEIIAEYLEREGVEYLVGIPGHGSVNILDAFNDSEIEVINPRHEQGAAHLADGYARASGDPLVVYTSIGPGATNTVTGVATAFVDSIPMVVITGGPQTHEYGKGVLQEIERKDPGDFPSIMDPITKQTYKVGDVESLPRIMRRAFQKAVTGRPGPVHIEVPMDVQGTVADVEIPDPASTRARDKPGADDAALEEAVELLENAERPLLIPGGGCMLADAEDEVRDLAESLQAPVAPTYQGKGIIPEDHDLFVGYCGRSGSTAANELSKNADVILAIGVRFTDLHTSSWRQGVTFEIPPTDLIHVDIDPDEIGKNYPVEVGIVGDAKVVAQQLSEAFAQTTTAAQENDEYYREIQQLWEDWEEQIKSRRTDEIPMNMSYVLGELREVLDRDGIVASSAGLPQELIHPELPVFEPRTNLSPGGFSTMGFGPAAALGAKLARPDRQVVAVEGDGSFLQINQELATAVEYDIDIVVLLLNNHGWKSIRNLQVDQYGWDRVMQTEFPEEIDVDYVTLADAFNIEFTERVLKPENVSETIAAALEHDGPALVDCIVQSDSEDAGAIQTGEWDLHGVEK